jgi:hypothetical protein
MVGAVGGAVHLSKEDRHAAVLTIDNPPNNQASLSPLRDLVDALALVRGLGDDSDGVRLHRRRRSPAACKCRPASAGSRNFAPSEPGRR